MKIYKIAFLCLLTSMAFATVLAQGDKSAEQYQQEIGKLSNSKAPGDQDKAYQLGKEYLAKYPSDKTANATKVRDWIKKYRLNKFFLATDATKAAEAYPLGNEILIEEPENIEVLFLLAHVGYADHVASKNTSFVESSIANAQKAIGLIERGVVPSNYAPFKDKPELMAFMHYEIGAMSMPKDPKAGAANYYKATQFESRVKSEPAAYLAIARYYEDVYQKLGTDLNARSAAKTISDADAKVQQEKLGKLVELMLDAYARTYSRLPATEAGRASIEDRLKQIYRFLTKSDTGLDAFVTRVASKPMPDPAAFMP